MNNIRTQAKFYDSCPPLVPWPQLLKTAKLTRLYKPREIFWKKELDRLKMRKKSKVLEIGCGQGLFLARIVEQYGLYGVGIDISSKSIDFARSHYSAKNISYKVGSGTKIPFKDGSFDYVISFDVFEHIEEQKKNISEMMRVLAPRGKLLIYTLNKDYRFTLDWIWQKLGIDIFSRAAHDPKLFVSPEWLKREINKKGGRVVSLNLFDAFFNLALDELIMIFVLFSSRAGLFKNKALGNIFLIFSNLISGLFFSVFSFLDSPWLSKGYSLSFAVIAEKEYEKEKP